MIVTKRKWLVTAKATDKGNGKNLCKWAYAMVQAADIPEESKSVAMIEAMSEIQNGGFRGDISLRWIKCGFTSEQFNYELFV